MKSSKHFRYALGVCVSAAMFTGCGGSQSAFAPSATERFAQTHFARDVATNYKVLFSFVRPRGTHPRAGLTALDGILYGTTSQGGAYRLGTVFSVTTSGQERVLHSFNGTYGAFPAGALTDLNGLLYGTTTGEYEVGQGCVYGCGLIFSITTTGKERAVYSFKGAPDGEFPNGLTAINGTLYGATRSGGTGCVNYLPLGCGTVFSVTTAGKERVLYSFKGLPDGNRPSALTALNGMLYGTTLTGGSGCGGSVGCGTVFSVTTSGTERVLYSFKSVPDGAFPNAGLTALNGTLYGTTSGGGTGCAGYYPGCGTVFSVTTSGTEHVLYRFRNAPDGAYPNAGFLALKGRLYGTTSSGGSYGGNGTVFSLTTAGKERVLYSFEGLPDASDPEASLTALNGILYGTTAGGGAHTVGTIFALTP